jgi:ABC-type phosphate transport system substrate-binding protein
VAKGTDVRISSGSNSMNAISDALSKGFQGQYANAKVTVAAKDANAALQDVLNDNADLAAISRPLTAEEKAKGLIEIPVRREKIAIVVGKDNPFTQSITGSQFAQIFRGEIKDWSGVGGAAGPIRMIDRPTASETRQALKPYPVFTTAEFKTGSTATQIKEDSTAALVKELGKDGIGYALVSQIQGQSDIKAIPLHKTLPDDARYPFSQPYSYVYAGGASPAVAAFLGYATGAPGQTALSKVQLTGSNATAPTTAEADKKAANAEKPTQAAPNNTGNTNGNTNGNTSGANGNNAAGNTNGGNGTAAGTASGTNGTNATAPATTGTATAPGTAATDNNANASADSRGRWWWLLLPLAGLGLLIWAAGRRSSEEETGYVASTGSRTDDRISSDYRSDGRDDGRRGGADDGGRLALNTEEAATAGRTGSAGLGSVVAGGTALAGGAAVAGAGLAGRLKNQAGDVTMDLDGIPGSVQGGVDGLKTSAQTGLGNLRSNIQSGLQDNDGFSGTRQDGGMPGSIQGGIPGKVQGTIESAKTTMQGSIDSGRTQLQGGIDGIRTNIQGGVDNIKGNAEGVSSGSVTTGESWLDRAKKRINEATEQIKDTAADIKDDLNKE